jgi:AbrB family looped-hinge helix DNA binding protein
MATKVLPPQMSSPAGAQTSVVNDKGQIVIPADVRKRLGLTPGTRVVFWAEGNRVIIQSVEKFLDELPGIFGPGPSLEDMREKDHRRDDKER